MGQKNVAWGMETVVKEKRKRKGGLDQVAVRPSIQDRPSLGKRGDDTYESASAPRRGVTPVLYFHVVP